MAKRRRSTAKARAQAATRSKAAVQGWKTRRANERKAHREKIARRRDRVRRPSPARPVAAKSRPPKRSRSPRQRSRKPLVPQKRKRIARRSPPKRKRPTRRTRPTPKRPTPRKRHAPKLIAPTQAEYAVSLSYAARKRASNVNAQLAILGPENADRDTIEQVIATKLDTGHAPKGWRIKWTEWRNRDVDPERQTQFFEAFRNFADKAERDEPISRPASAEVLQGWQSESEDEE